MSIRQFQAQRMHAPRDFQSISSEPVCVEIGAGKGKHALLFTQTNPNSKLIAIERTREKFLAMQNSMHWKDNRIYRRFMLMPCLGLCMHSIQRKSNSSLFYIRTLSRITRHSAG